MIDLHANIKAATKGLLPALLVLLCAFCLSFITACTSPSPTNDTEKPEATESTESSANTEVVAVEKGAKAPDFTFTTIDGTTAKLSDYQGKIVLLNFWATWCGYCIQEMPDMQQITENYSEVVVLAINRGDDSPEAIAFAEESDYDFIWGLDEDGAISALYPSNGIPYSIIIDAEGTIVAIYEGSAPEMYQYFESAVISAGA